MHVSSTDRRLFSVELHIMLGMPSFDIRFVPLMHVQQHIISIPGVSVCGLWHHNMLWLVFVLKLAANVEIACLQGTSCQKKRP